MHIWFYRYIYRYAYVWLEVARMFTNNPRYRGRSHIYTHEYTHTFTHKYVFIHLHIYIYTPIEPEIGNLKPDIEANLHIYIYTDKTRNRKLKT